MYFATVYFLFTLTFLFLFSIWSRKSFIDVVLKFWLLVMALAATALTLNACHIVINIH